MNFTITISGNQEEMPEALMALRTIMDGHKTSGGEVTAKYEQPSMPTAPLQQPPAQGVLTGAQVPQPTYSQQPDLTTQQPQTQPPAPPAVPTAAQTYSMEQLAVAATQLVDAGRRQDLVNLLNQFGVQALTALPKEQYGAFATRLREMGAKI